MRMQMMIAVDRRLARAGRRRAAAMLLAGAMVVAAAGGCERKHGAVMQMPERPPAMVTVADAVTRDVPVY
ncbi:MAG: hypothetical protein HY718_03025, partial [Planctomycetes bacterium]|nr:hypothetical protein [Planctomycetota bacterium]